MCSGSAFCISYLTKWLFYVKCAACLWKFFLKVWTFFKFDISLVSQLGLSGYQCFKSHGMGLSFYSNGTWCTAILSCPDTEDRRCPKMSLLGHWDVGETVLSWHMRWYRLGVLQDIPLRLESLLVIIIAMVSSLCLVGYLSILKKKLIFFSLVTLPVCSLWFSLLHSFLVDDLLS